MLDAPVTACSECPLSTQGTCAFVPRKLAAGAQLWPQGEVPREVLFIKRGVLAMSATDASGQELGAAVRGPRSLLGLEALRGQPARASVAALTDAVVCSASPAAVKQCASGEPANVSALWQLTLDELMRVERDGELRSGSAVSRVARFILVSGGVIASGQKGPFSKRHVAALLGLRPETMSRCLRQLEQDGLITSGSEVRILDEARLRSRAAGD
jgi:CRP/FNR family transcriptional regulator, cyclic AMP receptor protein